MSRPVRLAARAASASLVLAAALAAPAQAAQTAKLEYLCTWPEIGTQPVTVDLSLNVPAGTANYPYEGAYGGPTKITLSSETSTWLARLDDIDRLAQVNVPAADEKGNGIGLRIDRPDGTSATSIMTLFPRPYRFDGSAADPVVLDANATISAPAPNVNGKWTFNAGNLLLNLKALDADQNALPRFRTPTLDPLGNPVTDADRDPASATIPCVRDSNAAFTRIAEMIVSDGPTKVTGVTIANVTQTSADLSWDASTDPDGTVKEYLVSVGGNGGQSDPDLSVRTTGTSVRLENLAPDTSYPVTVYAVDDVGAFSEFGGYNYVRTLRRNGDARLTYRCKFPLAGTSSVSFDVETDLPATWQAGTPTPAGPVSAKLFLDVNGFAAVLGPETGPFRMESVTDAEKPGKGTALGLTASFADGTSAGVRIPLGASPYEQLLPSWEYLSLDFAGTAPPIVFPAAGASTFDATSLTLNLRGVYPDGTPVPGLVTPLTDIARNPYEDIDGDPATFNVPCALETNVSPRIATTTVEPATQPPGPVKYGYALKGSTQLKTLTKGTLQLSGSIAAELTLATGAFTADLRLADTSGRLIAAGFLPVTAKVGFAPSGKTTGSLVDGVLKTSSKVRIKVKEVKLFGAIPLAGGNNCQTKQLSDINLTSTQDEFSPLVGGPIAGTYKISDLNGCGPLNGLVSPLTAGGGNTISLDLTPQN